MVFVEFLEFLGRVAFLIWPDPEEPLDMKLWRFMDRMFGLINEKVSQSNFEDLVDSESDYEDEIAQKIYAEQCPNELYNGFGIMKPPA